VWQIKGFKPEMARFVKLRALKNTSDDDVAGYAELEIIIE
jgi:alpha-L-fucosidase